MRAIWLVGVLAFVAVACGADGAERTAASTTSPVATASGVGSTTEAPPDSTADRVDAFDQAPVSLVGPRLAAFDDGLLAWGLTASGDGGLAVIDSEATGWFEVQAVDEVPYCGSAVELGDGVALIGNVASDEVIGLLIDIESRTAETFDIPDALRGHQCPGTVATDSGLIVWTNPDAQGPVVAFAFDAVAETWDELPPPPFPADTYEIGGVWADEQLVMIGSAEGQPSFIGAWLRPGNARWDQLAAAPIATWEEPQPIWSGSDLIITSSWPQLITGGEVNPFPEPLAPGGTYNLATDTWQVSSLAPDWTDGIPVWTDEVIIWWLPGNEHATVYDPEQNIWWHVSAPTSATAAQDHDILWAGAWTGTQIVATDGTELFSWTPDLQQVVELDPLGKPRTDEALNSAPAAGTRTGQLGLLGRACGSVGRNTITITVTEVNEFILDYVIDREEPCGVDHRS